MTKTARARLWLVLSMVAFGTISIFVKAIALPSAEISLYRAVIASVVLTVYLLANGRLRQLRTLRSAGLLLFLSGAAMGFNWIFLFTAYRYTTVALSTLSYYFAPTLIVLGSSLLFRERLTAKKTVCFLCSTAGLALILGVSGGGSSDRVGVALGLSAALLYACVVLLNRRLGHIDGITRTWVQFVSAVLVLAPYVALTGGFHLSAPDLRGWGSLLILGVFHTGIVYVLYFTALSSLNGQSAAILSYIDPAVSVLASVFVLCEPITWTQVVGGLMILLFALLNELPGRQR